MAETKTPKLTPAGHLDTPHGRIQYYHVTLPNDVTIRIEAFPLSTSVTVTSPQERASACLWVDKNSTQYIPIRGKAYTDRDLLTERDV